VSTNIKTNKHSTLLYLSIYPLWCCAKRQWHSCQYEYASLNEPITTARQLCKPDYHRPAARVGLLCVQSAKQFVA